MWDLVPWRGIEPRPLHWECRVLATGPPGKSWENTLPEATPSEVALYVIHSLLYQLFPSLPLSQIISFTYWLTWLFSSPPHGKIVEEGVVPLLSASVSHSGNSKATGMWNSRVGLRPAPGSCHYVVWRSGKFDYWAHQSLIDEASGISYGKWSYYKLKNWEKMPRKQQQKHVFFMPFKCGLLFHSAAQCVV